MRSVMVMFDSLNRNYLESYGCTQSITPNFVRLAKRTVQFDTCYAGSLPCVPARRELHTGRYNFLHRSWGPLEPFDDSLPEILRQHGIYSHLVSDHMHYWEDGGATYHTRYSSWESFRGQEGDPWKGVVGDVDMPENLIEFQGYRKKLHRQDSINRSYMKDESQHPQTLTFDAGLYFIQRNIEQQNWFLQIECFDPHEPFFSYDRYKALFPHRYNGKQFDWPDYAPVNQTQEQVDHLRKEYMALLSMCDTSLGRVLDLFDQYDMWQDTQLIVCTDHGYLLGEHGYWAKNYMPLYDEIARTPLFIHDPRAALADGQRRQSLVQMIDIPATILSVFDVPLPDDMQGQDILPVLIQDKPIRKAGLFGIHGMQVCVTDGRRIYMKAQTRAEQVPLYNYTLMPTHMVGFFSRDELQSMEISKPFTFTKQCPVMRFRAGYPVSGKELPTSHDLLFLLDTDPNQEAPLINATTKDVEEMTALLIELLEQSDAPDELYDRLALRMN